MNIIVRTTDKCNAKCSYCYVDNKKNATLTEEITEQFLEFVNQLYNDKRIGRNHNVIWHGGEPFLLGVDYYKSVEECISPHIKQSMQSNLLAYNDDWREFFLESRIQLGTSLDGPKEVHDKSRGKGTWDKVIEAIMDLRAFGLPMNVIAVMSDKSDVEEMFWFFKEFKMPSIRLHPATGQISPEDYEQGCKDLFDLWNNFNRPYHIDIFDDILNQLKGRRIGRGVCSKTDCYENCICLTSTGDITGCNRLVDNQFKFGNILTDSFEEIMFGKKRVELINKIRTSSERCMNCQYYRMCKGGCAHESYVSGFNGQWRDTPYCPKGFIDHVSQTIRRD